MEMAIVLIIMGIVAGTAMPSILKYREQARMKETKDRQEQIAHAVGAFAVVNSRTPCPADPNAIPAQKGMERDHCSDSKSALGIVPYRDLGLTESQAKDGYGRYFTYVVPAQLRAGSQPINVCKLDPIIPIQIKDQDGTAVNQTSYGINNPVVLAIISHGPARSGESMHSEEKINSDSLTFNDGPFSLNEKKPFRQIIKWVTGQNLITNYGKGSCDKNNDMNSTFRTPLHQPEKRNSGLGDPFGRNN